MIPRDSGREAGGGLLNVSRRGLVAGAGAGALVLAVGLPPRGAGAQQGGEKRFGADGMPNGWRGKRRRWSRPHTRTPSSSARTPSS